MSKEYSLDHELNCPGVFWNPAIPEDKFSAMLRSDGQRIELDTSAELLKPERSADLFLTANRTSTPDIIHGFTTEGPCSLVGLHDLGGPGLADFTSGNAVRSGKFGVSACVMGKYIEDDTLPILKSAWFSYTAIDQWLPGAGKVLLTADERGVLYPNEPPVVLDLSICADKTRLWIKIHSNFRTEMGGRACSAKSEPIIGVEPQESKPLDWFFDIANRFENFFSLCLGSSVNLRKVHLSQDRWLVYPRPFKAQDPDLILWIRSDPSKLARAISVWFSEGDQFRPVENLIYGTIRNSSLFVETEFLSLAQALESLHRVTHQETLVEPSSFSRLSKACVDAIEKVCGDPLFSKLKRAIELSNEPDFKQRIESLIASVRPEHAEALLGDPAVFEKTLRQTRNFLTHPGIKKQGHVLSGPKDLFSFNQKLHAFLRFLMLLRVGFPEELAFEPVLRQSRRFVAL